MNEMTDRHCDSSTEGGDQLSVVHLSRLHERVGQLREHLRRALLSDGPQLEMIVYDALVALYDEFYYPLFLFRTASVATVTDSSSPSPSVSVEIRFATSSYTQDILAACVYLMDVDRLPDLYVVPSSPPALQLAHNEANASHAYVSVSQRHFCFLLFMYVCWSDASVPLKDVLHALYPLLDPGGAGDDTITSRGASAEQANVSLSAPEVAENVIAANLFSQPRFAIRKRLLGAVLSGLVLSRPHGLRSLLRVLLLDDRVETGTTMEASQLLVRLLTTPPTAMWILVDSTSSLPSSSPFLPSCKRKAAAADEKGGSERCVELHSSPSIEMQIQCLAPQLLALLEEQAEEGPEGEFVHDTAVTSSGVSTSSTRSRQRPRQPGFLAQLEALNQRLPVETLEHRLHLFLTLLLNALVRLPPRASHDFARCYRQFFYTNKHILTPGFGCLSLRSDGSTGEADVVAALRRLTSLVKGVSLGAGTAALSHVLPATAPGILDLCAMHNPSSNADGVVFREAESDVSGALRRFLQPLLTNPSLHELTAHAFVPGCTVSHTHSFSRGNALEQHSLVYADRACPPQLLTRGLEWLLFSMAIRAPEIVHVFVEAIADAAQLQLYASGVESLSTPLRNESGIDRSESALSLPEAPQECASCSFSSDSPPLVVLLERLCLEAPSEAVFGTREQLSLIATLRLLGRLAGLSVVLYRWSTGMLKALLRSNSVRITLQNSSTPSSSPSSYDAGQGLKEHRRFLARFVRTCESVVSTIQLLNDGAHPSDSSRRASVVVASLIADDAHLETLTTEVIEALHGRIADAVRELNETSATCKSAPHDSGNRQCSRNTNEMVVTVTAQWQRLSTQLQSALDGRSSAEIAMTLTSLSRSVDDVVHDLEDPQPLQSVVQPLLLALIRVLYECEEVGSAVRAVHCVAWLCMYRFDSPDSTFVADVVWAVLGEATVPAWLASQIKHTQGKTPASLVRTCRLRARLLDVLLAWTDYDEDGRTLRNIDDALRRTRHVNLYEVLVRLCHHASDMLVQVATLHLVGGYALAVYPRVPLTALCELCRDVFRLSQHEMPKAACAAALGKVVATLCHSANDTNGAPSSSSSLPLLLTEVDLEACHTVASAMASYRGRPPAGVAAPRSNTVNSLKEPATEVEMHDAVIQQHGRDMLQLLRRVSLASATPPAEQVPSVLRVQHRSAHLP